MNFSVQGGAPSLVISGVTYKPLPWYLVFSFLFGVFIFVLGGLSPMTALAWINLHTVWHHSSGMWVGAIVLLRVWLHSSGF